MDVDATAICEAMTKWITKTLPTTLPVTVTNHPKSSPTALLKHPRMITEMVKDRCPVRIL
jgi:hypothetical protein